MAIAPGIRRATAAALLAVFRGREDRAARQVGAGFTPTEVPITEAAIVRHLAGEMCYGFYLCRPDSTVWCTALDYDGRSDSAWRKHVAAASRVLGDVPHLIEISQSGDGAHVWVVFDRPVGAARARALWCDRLTADCGSPEIFPKQDSIRPGGLGNLLRYPLFGLSRFAHVTPGGLVDVSPLAALCGLRRMAADHLPQPEPDIVSVPVEPHKGGRIGDDYNARGDIRPILRRAGWTSTGTRGDNEYWRRPGKADGHSATLRSDNTFYVFSSSAGGFAAGKAYSPFFVYAALECGGEFSEAVKRLAALGYGRQQEQPDGLEVVNAATVKEVPLRWLWPSRVPAGKVTLLAGDPGLGKSFLTCDMASRVTTGNYWPDSMEARAPQGSVVMLSAEDDPADTIVPRLRSAGADLSRVDLLRSVRVGGRPDAFVLRRDLPLLEAAIRRRGDCRLVVIDPISCYLGGTDGNSNVEVRGALAPLGQLAERTGAAVVVVSHLRKGDGDLMYRVTGSLAFVAAARATWAVEADREDPQRRRRVMRAIKMNVARPGADLGFVVDDYGGGAVLAWDAL